jgi:hypothetical protein
MCCVVNLMVYATNFHVLAPLKVPRRGRVQPNRDVLKRAMRFRDGLQQGGSRQEAPWINKGFLRLSRRLGLPVPRSCYLIAILTPPIAAFIGSSGL